MQKFYAKIFSMKKIARAIFILVLAFNFFVIQAEAKTKKAESPKTDNYEEIVLDTEETEYTETAQITTTNEEELSLKDKLKNIYNIEIEKYDKPDYLFKEILTKHYDEQSFMDNLHVWGAYNADFGMHFKDDGGVKGKYDSNALNIGFDGALKNNNADFRIMLGFPVNSTRNYVQTLFSDVYVGTNKIPHHRIQVGYYRPQVGYEGGNSAYTLPFLSRSQISRHFGTARKLGARVKGDYSLIDYDIGVFSSDTFLQEFFPGAEFIGWVNVKPLAKTDGRYGSLKIGGGIDGGHRDNNFFVAGAYVGYQYKKFSADFEWAQGNGYNGYADNSSNKHASGFYTTLGYMLTKKLQLLARYDQFNPNHAVNNNNRREYSVGMNYFVKGQALRIILNYVFCQNDNAKDSHRIMFGTQILI